MTAPLLSIVVPAYNAEAYIDGCLDSIAGSLEALSSTARDRVEVVVSENRSTDATPAIVDGHSLDCKVVRPDIHLVNRTENWNLGLRSAAGSWRIMLHADDLLVPIGMKHLMDFLIKCPPAPIGMVYGQHQMFTDPNAPVPPAPHWRRPARIDGPSFRRWSLAWNCPFPPFTAFRGTIFEELGGFDERFELVQDWDFWLRVTQRHDLVYLPRPFGMWRSHPYGVRGAQRFASEQLQVAALLSDRYGISNPFVRLAAETKARAKARWFMSDGDLSVLMGRKLSWQPGRRTALVIIRVGETMGRGINHLFRVGGTKAFGSVFQTPS
jgi:Glycosyl transferase family 2